MNGHIDLDKQYTHHEYGKVNPLFVSKGIANGTPVVGERYNDIIVFEDIRTSELRSDDYFDFLDGVLWEVEE